MGGMALIRGFDDEPARPAVAAGAAITAGSVAGLAAGVAMLATVATAASLASDPTAKPGVDTGVATVPNAITSFTFGTGLEQWNDGYTWATYPGIALHLFAAIGLGIAGAGAIAALLGRDPELPGGLLVGALYGVALQVVVLGGFVDGLQDVDTVHTAAPAWSWWAGHVIYGLVLGALSTLVIRRIGRRVAAASGARRSPGTTR